jgi:hypothetical protein
MLRLNFHRVRVVAPGWAEAVGDHEQVSPLAACQEIAKIEHLSARHLNGIPNNKLGSASVIGAVEKTSGKDRRRR